MNSVYKILLLVVVFCLPSLSHGDNNNPSKESAPVFVLVHGTFQWGGQWDPLSELLKKDSYIVHSPSLTGLGEREHLLSKQTGLSTHIEDITNYITWLDLENVILVSHSYGGAVITGVADKLGSRISHVVYIDTVPLNHGENLLDGFGKEVEAIAKKSVDTDGDGWLISADALRGALPTMRSHPWKTYTDRINLDNSPPKSGTIIVGTEAAEVFGYMRKQEAPKRAKARGWSLHTVEGPHTLQEGSPSKEVVAKILLDIAKS
jgi:pimeloyl-ACP methyl ester carboxylesterase